MMLLCVLLTTLGIVSAADPPTTCDITVAELAEACDATGTTTRADNTIPGDYGVGVLTYPLPCSDGENENCLRIDMTDPERKIAYGTYVDDDGGGKGIVDFTDDQPYSFEYHAQSDEIIWTGKKWPWAGPGPNTWTKISAAGEYDWGHMEGTDYVNPDVVGDPMSIQFVWNPSCKRDLATGKYNPPESENEYATGFVNFPDDHEYEFTYYYDSKTIHWGKQQPGFVENCWTKQPTVAGGLFGVENFDDPMSDPMDEPIYNPMYNNPMNDYEWKNNNNDIFNNIGQYDNIYDNNNVNDNPVYVIEVTSTMLVAIIILLTLLLVVNVMCWYRSSKKDDYKVLSYQSEA